MNTRMLIVAIAALAMVGCCTEGKFSSEAELPKLDALVFKSEGSQVYGWGLYGSTVRGVRLASLWDMIRRTGRLAIRAATCRGRAAFARM